MTWQPNLALNDFRTIARLARVELTPDDIRIEILKAPHVLLPKLPIDKMAVYVFSRKDEVPKGWQGGTQKLCRVQLSAL